MLENEKENLIRLTIDISEANKSGLLKKLSSFYCSSTREADMNVVEQWNIVRVEIIRMLIEDYMIPQIKKEIKEDLRESAERYVIERCGKQYREMLMAGPYRKPSFRPYSNLK
jgi:transcriptional accessory protein Tex/SPT6